MNLWRSKRLFIVSVHKILGPIKLRSTSSTDRLPEMQTRYDMLILSLNGVHNVTEVSIENLKAQLHRGECQAHSILFL